MANIFDLIPQSCDSIISKPQELDKIFSIFGKLIHSAIDSISAFCSKIYSSFDGHVGDASCQIRACFIAYLEKFNKNKKLKKEQNYLRSVLFLLSDYKQQIKTHCANWKFKTLFEIVNSFMNIINVDSDTIFLAKLFFLSRYKVTGNDGNDYINIDTMCAGIDLNRKAVKKIIHAYQNSITYESYRFMKQLTLHAGKQDKDSLNAEFYDLMLKRGDDNRVYLPAYATMITLIDFMLNEKIPLILKTCNKSFEPTYLSFQVNEKNIYQKSNSLFSINDGNAACIVISGKISGINSQAEAVKKLSSISIVDLLVLNMSSHPQYTGLSLQHVKDNPYKEIIDLVRLNEQSRVSISLLKNLEKNFVVAKNRALTEGYCISNQSRFFIHHIYCDNINNFLSYEKLNITATLTNDFVDSQIKEEFYA